MRVLKGEAAAVYVSSLERRNSQLHAIEPAVRRIITDVRRRGDQALRAYAKKFDGLQAKQPLRVARGEMRAAWEKAPPQLQHSLEKAASNIRRFSQWQKPPSWIRPNGGISLGQLLRPLDSVGCYVPGGRFPLISTLLMTVIPAQVAGVKNIRVSSPRPSQEVLAAAYMLRLREFYRTGGAQAIAALAYGTETIARVDKIVGPGNSYVTAAKKLVSFDCAIDMLAGPTEAMVVSMKGNPQFIAADLRAQAEHDPETLAVFITASRRLAGAVARELARSDATNDIATQSLTQNGAILVAHSLKQAFAWANRIAPEHLTIERDNLGLVENAGSIFLGDYSAQAAGDYASGPNHVLPTGGAARFRGGLSVVDFLKLITVQQLSRKGLKRIGPVVIKLAQTEGLRAHAESVRLRCADA
ncbi:MAG: histidinol dehydrogenase [Acidobacteria bacterium]|nr:histidinol dehydrogenase [Acidobacteriota bacterium]